MTTTINPRGTSIVLEGETLYFDIITDLPTGNYPFSVFTNNPVDYQNFESYDADSSSLIVSSIPGQVRIGPYYYINFGFYVLRVGPAPGEGSIGVTTIRKGASGGAIEFKVYLGASGSIATSQVCTMTRVNKRFGFLAVNNNNQVLIDSSCRNLFYLRKATYSEVISSSTKAGGHVVLSYYVYSPKIPVPFFTIPNTARGVAVTKIYPAPFFTNLWRISLLMSGGSTPSGTDIPEMYIFIEYDSQLVPKGTFGMIVYNETSGITFDSRLKPFLLKGAVQGSPPTSPYTRADSEMCSYPGNSGPYEYGPKVGNWKLLEYGSIAADAPNYGYPSGGAGSVAALTDGRLVPDNSLQYNIYSGTISKPMFYYPSVAQCSKLFRAREDLTYEYEVWFKNTVVDKWGCTDYGVFCRDVITRTSASNNLYVLIKWVAIDAGAKGPSLNDPGPEPGWFRENCAGQPSRLARRDVIYAPNNVEGGGAGASNWTAAATVNMQAKTIMVADASVYD